MIKMWVVELGKTRICSLFIIIRIRWLHKSSLDTKRLNLAESGCWFWKKIWLSKLKFIRLWFVLLVLEAVFIAWIDLHFNIENLWWFFLRIGYGWLPIIFFRRTNYCQHCVRNPSDCLITEWIFVQRKQF